jgi:hypothetical protein
MPAMQNKNIKKIFKSRLIRISGGFYCSAEKNVSSGKLTRNKLCVALVNAV